MLLAKVIRSESCCIPQRCNLTRRAGASPSARRGCPVPTGHRHSISVLHSVNLRSSVIGGLILQPHLVIWLALPLVMAVACTLLVAVAPSWPAAGVLLIAGRSAEVMNMRRISFAEPGTTDQLPVRPWLLPGRAVLARTVNGLDAGEDEIDAGEELLAVVVFAQLRPGFAH